MIDAIFAAAVRARRRWYARHPEARRRLARPVVSVGNLALGGSGKTPTVAHLVRRMLEWGERPAVLSRGYGRTRPRDGVVVVREPDRVVGSLEESGDEPLMLARELDGAAVLVSPDRYLAGCLAERRFGCTVHVLDDGFQHLGLARDVDLVIVSGADLSGGRTLPSGRMREPLDAIAAADAVLINGSDASSAEDLQAAYSKQLTALGARRVFRLGRRERDAWLLGTGESAAVLGSGPVAVLAGIARPERVAGSARAMGWMVADTLTFPDHHPYSRRDVDGMIMRARAAGAEAILTTAKDAIRLVPHLPIPYPIAVLPVEASIEPPAEFESWLRPRLEKTIR